MSKSPDTYSRMKGCFFGLAIGDSMGAPVEFKSPGEFPPVTGFRSGGAHDVEPGEWTDDMAMALAIADTYIQKNGELDLNHVLDNFLLWHDEGKFSSRGDCFDIGTTCARALKYYRTYKKVIAPTNGEFESGNGSLMRMAPVVVMHHHDLSELTQKCLASSRTTHTSEIVDRYVEHFARIVHLIVEGKTKNDVLAGMSINENAKPTGFVVDSLDVALIAFRDTQSFKEGLLQVVNQGEDADTVGAIYGQIAGAYYGHEAIPHEWKRDLWQTSMLEEVFETLWKVRTK